MSGGGSPSWQETRVENLKDTACQDLLRQQPKCHGWLRRKPKLQQIGSQIEDKVGIKREHSIVGKVSLLPQPKPTSAMQEAGSPGADCKVTCFKFSRRQQRYVILHNNHMYVFQTEIATKAQKVLKIIDYRFIESDEVKSSSNPWPFILEPIRVNDQQKLKPQYFCATTGEDLQKWKHELQHVMSLPDRPGIPIPGGNWTTRTPSAGDDDDTYDTASEVPSSIVDAAMWTGNPDDARKVLEENAEEGLFLLRKAVEGTGYTLMLISEGKPCKFRITENKQTKQVRFMDRLNFGNLLELINHFSNNPLPNKQTKLAKPISHCLADTAAYVW